MRGVSRLSAAASKSSGSEQRARLNLGNVPCALDAARSRDAVLTDDAGGLLGGLLVVAKVGDGEGGDRDAGCDLVVHGMGMAFSF
jgi:hypothetical protein